MSNFLNSYKERYKTGINLAVDSFALLQNHPILLIYLSMSIALHVVFKTASYQTYSYDLGFTGITTLGSLFDLSRWHHYFLLLALTFGYIYISTFLTACLISHIDHFLRYEHITISANVCNVRKKAGKIFYWSLIITGLSYLLQLLSSLIITPRQLFMPYMIIISSLGLAWSLITFLVLPIITFEKGSLWLAIKQSKTMVLTLLVEIIAGSFWIFLITALAATPGIIALTIALKLFKSVNMLVIFAMFFTLLIFLITSTAQVIFRTMLYTYYTKPIDELKRLKYPRF